MVERGVLRNVQNKGGFSHRWAARDDNEIRLLKTCGDLVKILESAGHSSNRFAALLEKLDPLHGSPEHVLDARETLCAAALVDLEDLVLRRIEEIRCGRGRLERLADNRRRDL